MTGTDLADLGADDLVRGYGAGAFTPTDVVERVVERIAEQQPRLNCFSDVLADSARAEAAASTARWAAGTPRPSPAGTVDGVPATVKENVAVAGVPRRGGCAAYADAPAETADGPATARMREAGAVLVGVTVMPDLGMLSSGVSSLHGTTRSPWDLRWSVGGSSSGAAAAAAAGLGVLHVGSDIGGSLRLPASWTATATLKPTAGRVPVDPPYPGRVAGPLARSVRDVVRHLGVLAQPDARDVTRLVDPWAGPVPAPTGPRALAGLRVGLHTDAGAGTPTDPEVAAVVRAAADTFAAAGAEVVELAPFLTPDLLAALDRFLRVRSWTDLVALPEHRRALVLPFVREWAQGGADVGGTEVIRCFAEVQRLRTVAVHATAPFDVVLSPAAPVATFPAEWPMPSRDPATALHHCGFTAPYNSSEQPAAALNAGWTADGRPVGLQIAGARSADAAVLRAALWFEDARGSGATPRWPR
ncbi:amidase [Kineococcus rubinsiae]|uniref:amidase n=1 Tax=Kineococcus rubinsiae TaxID=2609562 RepID=UPI00142FAFE0|nr:amidase [Kineococcus rubinsiae]